jgi:hypothetical protein
MTQQPKSETPGPQDSRQSKAPRKPYKRPELSFYGDVTQVTRGQMSNMPGDAGGAATKMGCWIAEVLYGVDASRTLLVRAWLNEAYDNRLMWARIIMPMYRRYGIRVAQCMRSNVWLESALRPLFDSAVRRAHRKYAAQIVGIPRTTISPAV